MSSVLIVHGAGGTPDENWFPWLKEKLEADNFDVLVPQFPNTLPEQNLSNWLTEIDKFDIDDDIVAVGHSLGVPFLLNLLEKRKLKAVYLVAGFTGLLNNQFDEIIDTFSNREFNWDKIKENCEEFHIIHSDNDPYVASDKAVQMGTELGIEPKMIKDAGHFNFPTFEYLYSEIKSSL